jgi:WD40 repeat protein
MSHARHTIAAFAGKLAVAVFVLAGVVAHTQPTPLADAPEAAPCATDRLGDPLPPGATARFGTVRLRHRGAVLAVVFSPDGELLASAGNDGAVRFWDVATAAPAGVLRGDAGCLAFAPDGKTLAVGSEWGDGSLGLWDVATRKEVRRFGAGTKGRVHAVGFAPDGSILAAGGPANPVRFWDPATGAEKAFLGKDADHVSSLAFTPDGKILAAVCQHKVRLWDVASRAELPGFGKKSEKLTCLAIASDGSTLATGSEQGRVRLWDLATRKEVRSWPQVADEVAALAFSADGKQLACSRQNQKLPLWDVATGRELRAWPAGLYWTNTVALSPDGRIHAAAGEGPVVQIRDVRIGKRLHPLAGHDGWVHTVVLLPDGLVATCGDAEVRVWRDAGEEVRALPEGTFGADRRTLIVWERGTSVRLMDALTGKERQHFPVKDERAALFALARDGRTFAAWESQETLRVFHVETGKELWRLACETTVQHDELQMMTFSPDGKLLLFNRRKSGLWLWDAGTGKEVTRIKADSSNGFDSTVHFSPDGKWVAGGRSDWTPNGRTTVGVYDTHTGRELRSWPSGEAPCHMDHSAAMAVSPDGRWITIPGGVEGEVVRLLSVATGHEKRFQGHRSGVHRTVFAADGRSLATGSADDTIRVWEVTTGQERLRLSGEELGTHEFELSQDGRTLVSANSLNALAWDLTGLAAGGRMPRLRLTPEQSAALWSDLGEADAAKAYRALWRLVAAEPGVPVLRDRLRPAAPLDVRKLSRLLADLDSPQFADREQATRELVEAGDCVVAPLRKLLAESPSVEVRRRVEDALEQIATRPPAGEALRALRAVEALERIGNQEAQALLRELAKGVPEAMLTREARSSLRRLEKGAP